MYEQLREEIEKHSTELGLAGLLELHDTISRDRDPLRQVQGIYLFSETKDNQEAVFQSAKDLRERGLDIPVFVINDRPEDSEYKPCGFPGFNTWSQRLNDGYGIKAEPIDVIDAGRLNTFTEAQALVKFSRENNLGSWYVVAPQFHMLRAFMGAASVAVQECSPASIFACYGVDQDWNESVVHSQGITKGRRIELVKGELERIKKYTKPGNLLLVRDVLGYVSQRQEPPK